ncbi:MAG: hypothetical protein OWQ54_00525 [Sulfolobaceae archaeon]|nr:hypothetical protein [Sulfolobaceae archaeon]
MINYMRKTGNIQKIVLLALLFTFTVICLSAHSLSPGQFIVYNGTAMYYQVNTKPEVQKMLYVQELVKEFSNGTGLFMVQIFSYNTTEGLPPSYEIENLSFPQVMYYISPSYLGKNITVGEIKYVYNGTFNGFYVYVTKSQLQNVVVYGIYYYDSLGVAEKVMFLQYGVAGLISNTTYVLWLSNILYPNETLPKFDFKTTAVQLTISNAQEILPVFIGGNKPLEYVSLIAVILLTAYLTFRKRK